MEAALTGIGAFAFSVVISTALHRVILDAADKRRGTAHDGRQACDGQLRRQATFAFGDRVKCTAPFVLQRYQTA
jgi:hypothetical protein